MRIALYTVYYIQKYSQQYALTCVRACAPGGGAVQADGGGGALAVVVGAVVQGPGTRLRKPAAFFERHGRGGAEAEARVNDAGLPRFDRRLERQASGVGGLFKVAQQ